MTNLLSTLNCVYSRTIGDYELPYIETVIEHLEKLGEEDACEKLRELVTQIKYTDDLFSNVKTIMKGVDMQLNGSCSKSELKELIQKTIEK